MTQKQILVGSDIIYYNTAGYGKPVVLLHGFAEDSTVWRKQVDFLKDSFRLIVPELPGTGTSALLQKEKSSLEDHADVIRCILDQEDISQCSMIGHSMGGYITLAFAEKYPAMLESFMLFHSSAFADDAEKIDTRKKGIAFIEENGPHSFLKKTIPALFYDEEKSKVFIEDLVSNSEKFSGEALIQYYEAMICRPDRTAVLKEFPRKIGFIMGQHDKAVPFEQSLQQTHLPKTAYVYIMRNSAHMSMLEEWGKANDCLQDFLSNETAK